MAKKKQEVIKITDMTGTELAARAKELRREVAKTRMEIAAKKQRNTRKAFNLRRELARTRTVLNIKLMR